MDSPFRGCLWAALALASASAISQAPAPAPALSWAQALDAAVQRAREAGEATAELGRAQAERRVVDEPWAAPPALGAAFRTGRSPGNGSLRETELGVAWPLWLPGQRQARAAAADASVLAAQRSADAARLRIAGQLRDTALAVAAQEAEMQQALLQARLVKALAEDVERRVRAGDLARADAMAANAELLQAQAQQQEAGLRLQQARDRWLLLTGLAAVPAWQDASRANAASAEHPDLALAAAQVERARRRLDAAEKSRRDPPEVGVSVRREADASGSANSAGVTLRLPFATGDRNAVALAQARSELDLAVADEERVRTRLALESRAAGQQLEGASQQLAAERARAALLRERAGLIEKSFRAGETALPELLRALAAAAQADAAVVRQQAALAQAEARLAQSLGVLP
jgi:outer membrane protein, heavy metal efflux system